MQSFYLLGNRKKGFSLMGDGGVTGEEHEISRHGGVSFGMRVEVTNDGFCELARDLRRRTRECRD